MKIATWNVNSIRTRVDRVIEVLQRHDLDALAMQEIKCRPDQFPTQPFEEAGYHLAIHGLNQWNGVAIASKYPLENVENQFAGQPGWGDPQTVEARALGATVVSDSEPPLRLWSLYVPNGRELDNPHYAYKLEWLKQLQGDAQRWLQDNPEELIALVGDWNIAPLDGDVWDIEAFAGKTHVSQAERDAFDEFAKSGFVEVTRPYAQGYTYWDYQQLRFPKNQGMKIDFVYASPALAKRVTGAEIDRNERKGKGASDHVPVIVEWS